MVRFVSVLLLALMCAPQATAQSISGTWTGSGHETHTDGKSQDYPIVMVIAAGGGSIDYPSLGCGGSVSQRSGDATSAQYIESITRGRDHCIDGGSITVNLVSGKLAWTWTGQGVSVTAVLERSGR
jgi:hypothetical protein